MATTILDELAWRGLVAQSTDIDALAATAAVPPMTVYAGFDPTAPSLHAAARPASSAMPDGFSRFW